jgi:hypothetical protein
MDWWVQFLVTEIHHSNESSMGHVENIFCYEKVFIELSMNLLGILSCRVLEVLAYDITNHLIVDFYLFSLFFFTIVQWNNIVDQLCHISLSSIEEALSLLRVLRDIEIIVI